jgi:hypothetical protein
MKKHLSILFFLIIFHFDGFSQRKWEFGVKVAANQLTTKLYEFMDPFPYYERNLSDGSAASKVYGTNPYTISYCFGVVINHNLFKSKRVMLNSGLEINNKTYKQRDNNFNSFKVNNTYLDVPLSLKLQPFYNAGLFLEPGIYQAFNLSGKTKFPAINANSSEFEKRRARANARETNLFGFKIGAGYEFKKIDVSVAFQSDKQYDYVQLGLRVKLPKLLDKN